MKMRTIGILSAVVAALVWWMSSRPTEFEVTAAPARPIGLPATSPTAPRVLHDGCRFSPGTQWSYAAALRASVHQTTPGLNVPSTTELDLVGRLEFEVLSARPDGAVLAGRWALTNQSNQPSLDVNAFRTPFLVAVDGQCQLQGFARWEQASPSLARNQQAVIWDTQFRWSSGDIRVADASGIAFGQVSLTADGLQRTLTRYESTWPGEPAGLKLSATMSVRTGAGPWFETLESHREQFADELSNVSTLTLRRQEAPVQFAAEERQETHYVWGDLLHKQAKLELAARPFTRFDRERQEKVSGQSLTQALDAFAQRVQQGVGTQSKWPELAAYFEAHPDALKPAYERYRQGELPPSAAGDFFLALSKTRNDEARELLLSVKRDEGAVMMDQVRAMFALVTRTDVGQPLAQELAGDLTRQVARRTHDSDFLGGEAMLALSTMSGLRNDPAIQKVSRQALETVLTSEPQTSHPARTALRAIGNMGDPAMLPLVTDFMRANDVDTRKAAAHAFSRMPPESTDALEVEWLKRETSPFVKKELYRVIQQQHFDLQHGAGRELVEQALSELPTTSSALVRRSMVFLIAQSAVAKDPDIRRALVEQAKKERAKGSPVLNQFGTILTRAERAEVLR